MFAPDMPALPPAETPILVAAASQSARAADADRTVGACQLVAVSERKGPKPSALNVVASVKYYLSEVLKQEPTGSWKTTILDSPQHGRLQASDNDDGRYFYTPDQGYWGTDEVTVLVELGDVRVKVIYFIHVQEALDESMPCPGDNPAEMWEIPVGDTTALPFTGYALATVNLSLAIDSLNGAVVGQAAGQSITLDPDAGGQDDRAMSRLLQNFILPEGVQALRFTITNALFTANGVAPTDAFEVALLDAATRQSVAGVASLSNTDSLFNLQSDGTVYASSCVTVSGLPATGSLLNTSAPITVTIDLSGVAAGTSLSLYFDLLGLVCRSTRTSTCVASCSSARTRSSVGSRPPKRRRRQLSSTGAWVCEIRCWALPTGAAASTGCRTSWVHSVRRNGIWSSSPVSR
jgi:hypothetical protein